MIAETLSIINTQNEDMSTPETVQHVNVQHQHLMEQIIETPQEFRTNPMQIKRIIKKFKNGKAPGDDGISTRILKSLNNKTIVRLNHIVNACLQKQYFPDAWKNAIVIPLKKPRKTGESPLDYRPISLTSFMSKILEKIIYKKTIEVEQQKQIIIKKQFGFVKGKGTDLQIAIIVNEVMKNNNLRHSTAMAVLDIEKAYDTVWRRALFCKMENQQFPPYLIKIIASYLDRRTVQVKIKENKSSKILTTEGLPQGSILSPILFNLYINDIPKTPNTRLAIFADDTAIYASSTRQDQAKIYIQRHLRILEEYYHKWRIRINVEKTQAITFNFKILQRPGQPLTM